MKNTKTSGDDKIQMYMIKTVELEEMWKTSGDDKIEVYMKRKAELVGMCGIYKTMKMNWQ
jgi:hypothetical protein